MSSEAPGNLGANMPTYLCHGFRWNRASIRVFIIVQNIDEGAPEWIIAPESSVAILDTFYNLFDFLPEPRDEPADHDDPKKRKKAKAQSKKTTSVVPPSLTDYTMPEPTVPPEEDDVLQNSWSAVKLLEEYDPTDLREVSRPYAYVADHVVRVDLSVSVTEEIVKYEERMAKESFDYRPMSEKTSDEYGKTAHKKGSGSGKKAGWFEKLRDQLQKGEDIRWYVVSCGDEEREVPDEIIRPEPAERTTTAEVEAMSRQRSTSASRDAQRDRSMSAASREYANARLSLAQRGLGPGSVPSSTGDGTPSSQHSSRHAPSLSREFATPASRSDEFMSPSALQYPAVPPKDYMSGGLRSHPPMEPGSRPKTPKQGGLRRLFSKKGEDGTP